MQNTHEMIEKQFQEREKIGKYLYGFAWAIEILAVLIGLAISIAIAGTGLQEMSEAKGGDLGFAEYTNIAITMMPFLMVAIVEITKIPFAGAFYNSTSVIWKSVFGITLLFLAFITFESAMNGFERNFSALTFVIDSKKKQVVNLDEKITDINAKIDEAEKLKLEDIEENYNNRRAELSAERDSHAKEITDRMNELRGSTETEYVQSLRDERATLMSRISSLEQSQKDELDRAYKKGEKDADANQSEIGARRRTLQGQLDRISKQIRDKEQEKAIEVENASFFSVDRIRKEYDEEIANLRDREIAIQDSLNNLTLSSVQSNTSANFESSISRIKERHRTELSKLQNQLYAVNKKISKSTAANEEDIKGQVETYRKELAKVDARFQEQQQANDKERESKLEILKNNSEIFQDLNGKLDVLRDDRTVLRDQINVKVGDNQVYRIAQWWFGRESAADLDRHEVMVIAVIWFGSLAALVAFTGILLALASYVIKDPTQRSRHSRDENSINKLNRSVRRYFVSKRKLLKEPIYKEIPKEVIKEVPVEKVIKVEKPVEIVRKVLVHVPFYTNDKKLLNMSYSLDDFEDFTSSSQTGEKTSHA